MELHWLSSKLMTGGVYTEDGIIVDGAPIFKRFMGQPLENLEAWLRIYDKQMERKCLGPTPKHDFRPLRIT